MTEDSSTAAYDIAIVGGRVIDPETGLDGIRTVGVSGGSVSYVGVDEIRAAERIDASGLVVAPGFIDMHSHAQDPAGMHFQVLDGVTTSLELESGAAPVRETFAFMNERGAPINFGFSASWAAVRLEVMYGVGIRPPADIPDYRAPLDAVTDIFADTYEARAATEEERASIVERLRTELDSGAIGIGMLLGYIPSADSAEIDSLFALAAETRLPLFVHSRSMAQRQNDGAEDAVRELIAAAEKSGAHVHLCHLNSTSGKLGPGVIELIADAQARGIRVTTEAYPYGSGATGIGAAFLAPELLHESDLTPSSIRYLATGERLTSVERLIQLRATHPDGTCIVDFLDMDVPAERNTLLQALCAPGAAIASDSGYPEYVGPESGRASAMAALDAREWPLPAGFDSHPRSAGTYSRSLRWLVRELGVQSLTDGLRRASLTPALILADAVPAMNRKGRVQQGADADLIMFDPDTVTDRADYGDLRPSEGFEHVLVGGIPVVRAGTLLPLVNAGVAVAGYRLGNTTARELKNPRSGERSRDFSAPPGT